MLSNAYFLAKFRFDTAENEPAKKLQNFAKINLPILVTLTQAEVSFAGSQDGSVPGKRGLRGRWGIESELVSLKANNFRCSH